MAGTRRGIFVRQEPGTRAQLLQFFNVTLELTGVQIEIKLREIFIKNWNFVTRNQSKFVVVIVS